MKYDVTVKKYQMKNEYLKISTFRLCIHYRVFISFSKMTLSMNIRKQLKLQLVLNCDFLRLVFEATDCPCLMILFAFHRG